MIPGGAYLWDPARNDQVAIRDGTAKHRREALHDVAQRMVWTNLRSQGSSLQHGGGGGAALDVHEAGQLPREAEDQGSAREIGWRNKEQRERQMEVGSIFNAA